jgi:hypothetical protein
VLPVCQVHVLRKKKGATCLPGATSEKWIFASNKGVRRRVCGGRQVQRACLAPQGRRVF